MGKDERASAETKANHISSRQKENRSGSAGKVGEVECWEEVGGLRSLGSLLRGYKPDTAGL
jgi:hypothetical protein